MARAGDYRDRLEWLKRTAGGTDAPGQRQFTYPSQGYLWCAVEDLAANRETVKNVERQVTAANVRVRGEVALLPGDRLADGETVWTVLTVVAGDNETLLEVDDVLKPT
jgi:hypothetical protein